MITYLAHLIRYDLVQIPTYVFVELVYPNFFVLVEYCNSGEDVSVNTVIMLRNWGAILADLRSEATEEARIAPQFRGMMTVLTDTSDPELLYSHC